MPTEKEAVDLSARLVKAREFALIHGLPLSEALDVMVTLELASLNTRLERLERWADKLPNTPSVSGS